MRQIDDAHNSFAHRVDSSSSPAAHPQEISSALQLTDTQMEQKIQKKENLASASPLRSRTRAVYETIEHAVRTQGYPPSIREIGLLVGVRSPSSVKHHMDTLVKLGYIKRSAHQPRAVEILKDVQGNDLSSSTGGEAGNKTSLFSSAQRIDDSATSPGSSKSSPSSVSSSPLVCSDAFSHGVSQNTKPDIFSQLSAETNRHVPLVGTIAAGNPLLAQQDVEETYTLPETLVGQGDVFMLRVRGDSMIDAAICDNDLVVIRRQSSAEPGEIVAALLDDEATVKTLSFSGGHMWLLPHNPSYSPILGDNARILGKVVAVLRSL